MSERMLATVVIGGGYVIGAYLGALGGLWMVVVAPLIMLAFWLAGGKLDE